MRSIRDGKPPCQAASGDTGEIKDDIESIARKYEGKSEDQLLDALRSSVQGAKRDGSFSAEQLDSFVAVVSSGLDEQSRRRLIELVEMIKAE